MKIVIFGLTISSSWGNGHATLWRGLCKALARRGHRIIFFEKDVPYYASHRDLVDIPGVNLYIYVSRSEMILHAARQLEDADVGIVTSYCPEGAFISELVLSSPARLRVFYDLDTPVTLKALQNGAPVEYIGERGLQDFDLVLSYTGGAALDELKRCLGARFVLPLYGSVDPSVHHPVSPVEAYRSDLSYLGTYAEDRQEVLTALFIEASRRLAQCKFLIGGSLYPDSFPWTKNIHFIRHVSPGEHSAFFCSSLFTLNVTRRTMAEMGYCPSGRLFEAAACGVPILSDTWEGLDVFFEPGSEIITVRNTDDVVAALEMPYDEASRIGKAARERTLEAHTASNRALDLEQALDAALSKSVPMGL